MVVQLISRHGLPSIESAQYPAPMNIYPSHTSALLLWRTWSVAHSIPLSEFHLSGKRRGVDLPASMLSGSTAVKTCASTHEDIAHVLGKLPPESRALLAGCEPVTPGGLPLEVLVGKKPGVRSAASVCRRQCGRSMPRNAFLEVAPGVWVSSPELVFAQMASRLTYGELLALGYELCGSYPIVGSGGDMVRRPLTTPERLLAFLEQLTDVRAIKLARSAAKQVRRKSASVMETELAIIALTPRRRGGLGLPDARLNEPRALSDRGRRIARQKYVVGDLCWWECGIVVEYDGRDAHSGSLAQARDSRRRDALLAEGVDVVTVTSAQFSNVYEFASLMGKVSEKTGKRFRGWLPGQIEKHTDLRWQVGKFHREQL